MTHAAILAYQYYFEDVGLDSPEKVAQEKRSLLGIDDSFRKIVVAKDVMRPFMDEDGILTMGLFYFLLDPNSLNL